MFRPDRPIKTGSEDILGRSPFAESLAQAILNYKDSASIVLGLFGRWGSGKTSIVNMILEKLTSESDTEKEPHPIIISFDSWVFSGSGHLQSRFFQQLRAGLMRKGSGVPLELPDKVFEYGEYIEKNPEDSWDFELKKTELDNCFEKLNRKIILILDDIDRLDNKEILRIFQIMKISACFPNTIYLAAIDKDVVIKGLEKVQEGSGLEYLEKVVQIPFEIPQISKKDVENFLFSRISELLKDIPGSDIDRIHWGNVYHGGLRSFFVNMRDVTRYMNSLKFGFSLVKNEVNPVDFMGITALHVFAPDVYFAVRDNKSLFTGIIDPEYPLKEKMSQLCDEIMALTTAYPRETIYNLLARLFPKVESYFSDSSYDGECLGKWRRQSRICSEDIFNVYFRLTIPGDTIPRKEIESILKLAEDRKAFENRIKDLCSRGLINDFLSRIEDYTDEIPLDSCENITGILLDMGDRFPAREFGFLGIDTESRIQRVIYILLQRYKTHEKRFHVLKNAIEKSKRCIFTSVNLLKTEASRLGIDDSDEIPMALEKTTVLDWQYEELEGIVARKLAQWAESGKLAEAPHLPVILEWWKKRCRGSEIYKFVKEMTKSEKGLIDFVKSFMFQAADTSGDFENLLEGQWRIRLYEIQQFGDLRDMEKRFRTIVAYPGFVKMEKMNRIAIKTFLATIEGRIKDTL